jgi:hypothetical protein
MSEQTLEFEARVYVYDLQNCAKEFGFKTDENWEIMLASRSEKTTLEKKYFPMLALRVLPESLNEMFNLVKGKMRQTLDATEKKPAEDEIRQRELQYLVAYSAVRLRN